MILEEAKLLRDAGKLRFPSMRRYPQPHSLQGFTSDSRLALQLHHAFKKGGYIGSILERMEYALSPVPVPVMAQSYRGRIITRD